jgi:hypothetical protein
MIRTIEEMREAAAKAGLSPGAIGRACKPALPAVTVWRIFKGKRGGNAATHVRISRALDLLASSKPRAKRRQGRDAPAA